MTPAQLLVLLITAALFALMVSLGLSLQPAELLSLRHRPWLILRVLLGSCLLLPLLALALLLLLPPGLISPPARLAIALMALCPSAPLTLRKSGQHGGDPELTAVLQVGAALLAILSLPLLVDLYLHHLQISGWDIEPPLVAQQIAKAQLLPLGLGVLVRLAAPGVACRLRPGLSRAAGLLQLGVVVLVLAIALPQLLPFLVANGTAAVAMALMAGLALLVGLLLAGPVPHEATTGALVTSMRNPGLALLMVATFSPGVVGAKLAILSYVLITVLVSIPFLRWRHGVHGGHGA
ncbi:MAG: transporter [Cyanobacteriota bacterium]|nr:transporter [Cyanobacteriota bacterium]